MTELLKVISDHGNAFASKIITYMGFTGAGITTAQVASNNPSVQKAMPIAQDFAQACSEQPQWLIYVPALMAFTLAFKHSADFYFRLKEHKKIMNEKTTDKDNIC